MAIELQAEDDEPLALSCDKADCANGLHCFGITRSKALAKVRACKGNHSPGKCQECGADLVDWDSGDLRVFVLGADYARELRRCEKGGTWGTWC